MITFVQWQVARLTFVVISENLSQALHACLNDYTTNERGDVGSLIRLEAIDATAVVLKKGLLSMSERQDIAARICGLAVEKLDKVRFRAWNCLQSNWEVFELGAKPQAYVELCLLHDVSLTILKVQYPTSRKHPRSSTFCNFCPCAPTT